MSPQRFVDILNFRYMPEMGYVRVGDKWVWYRTDGTVEKEYPVFHTTDEFEREFEKCNLPPLTP